MLHLRAAARSSHGAARGSGGSRARKGRGRGGQTVRIEVPLQSLQIASQLSRTLGPQIAILLQCLVDDSFQREWRGWIQAGDGLGVVVQKRGKNLCRGVAMEKALGL